jgi:hypothetical protein
MAFVISMATVELEPLGSRRVPFFVTMEQTQFKTDRPFTLRVREHVDAGAPPKSTAAHDARAVFLGARQ